jgi:hypothetical protein
MENKFLTKTELELSMEFLNVVDYGIKEPTEILNPDGSTIIRGPKPYIKVRKPKHLLDGIGINENIICNLTSCIFKNHRSHKE